MRKYLDDLLGVIGCALILVGTYQISPLATWFVAGAMCIGWAFLLGISGGSEYDPQ